MTHDDAKVLLEQFVDGELNAVTSEEVEGHAHDCAECTEWIATYSTIKAGLRAAAHPQADMLAAYALEPSDLSRDVRSEVESHLNGCRDCRGDYRSSRRALEKARPSAPSDRISPLNVVRNAGWRPAVGLAAAAVLAVALVVTIAPDREPDNRVADLKVEGSQIIEGAERLVATNVEVQQSARLDLRADKSIVLGEGFSVKRGASLVISTRHRGSGS